MALEVTEASVYDKLAERWPEEETHILEKGGLRLSYVSGEQVTTRLNRVLGPGGWSFEIVEHGRDTESDEVWVIGSLTAYFGDHGPLYPVHRQQFGSAKIKRSRSTGQPLDIGFDLKAASTDAFKKCAAGLGVGLYLSERSFNGQAGSSSQFAGSQFVQQAPRPQQQSYSNGQSGVEVYHCDECGTQIQPIVFKSGDAWSPARMAQQSRNKYGRTLCMEHYKVEKDRRDAPAVSSGPIYGWEGEQEEQYQYE